LKLWHQMRAFVRSRSASQEQGTRSVTRAPEGPAREQVVAAIECPLPLAEMYVDLLRSHGIPAMIGSSGVRRV
jgi:hypothetical protein